MKRLTTCLILATVLCIKARAQVNDSLDVLHYSFDLTLSDSSDTLNGIAAVTVRFTKTVRGCALDLSDNMFVSAVTENGQQLPYKHAHDSLCLAIAAAANEEHTYIIRYSGVPITGLIIRKNKYGDRCFFSDNWPNKTHYWLPVRDRPSDKATCELTVRAPEHYRVISNGILLEESALGLGKRLTHWKQAIPIPCWLFALGATDFAVQYLEPWHGIPVETWVCPQDRDSGFYNFAEPVHAALDFYDAYIGPYAYEKLANVEANSVGGATELATCIFYGDKSVTGQRPHYWQTTVAHEIAHHWFGNCVTEASWDDVWLSEGFATYFSFLFIEHNSGHDAFITEMAVARQKVFVYHATHKDEPIVHDHLPDLKRVTSVQTYQKGAWVLHMLRDKIGDIAFKTGIRAYYKRYFIANATTSDFKREMEAASGMPLDSFFNQWLYRDGNPKLSCAYAFNAAKKTLHLTVEQVQQDGYLFSFPLEIGIYNRGQSLPAVQKVWVNRLSETFDIPLAEAPAHIVMDQRTVLLADITINEAR